MQLIDGQPVFSATDLVGYLACEHLTALERAALAGLVQKPMREDRELDVIRRRGFEHEARYLDRAARRGAARSSMVERDDEAERGDRVRRQAAETIDGHGVGRRRHLPGDLLRRPLARSCRLPAAGRVAGSAIGLGAVSLRGRRHEAGSARQGGCRPADLLVRRAADEDPGRAARADEGRPRRERPRDGVSARRRLHGLLPGRQAPLRAVRARDRRRAGAARGLSTGRHLPGAGRTLRRLSLGGALCPAATRRRPSLARRRHHRPPTQGARRPRGRHGGAPGGCADPLRPAPRRVECRQHRARPRAGPPPGRRSRTGEADPRTAAPGPG